MDDRNYYAEYLEMQPQLEGEWNEADEWMGLYGTINPYAQPVAKYEPLIDYSADSGDFDTASRITPDPAGDDGTADDGRPVDVLRTAHTYRAVMARLYGTYSAKAQRAAAVFESLFATRNVKFA